MVAENRGIRPSTVYSSVRESGITLNGSERDSAIDNPVSEMIRLEVASRVSRFAFLGGLENQCCPRGGVRVTKGFVQRRKRGVRGSVVEE